MTTPETRTTPPSTKASPFTFILVFGVVSCLMDIVYQGALSIQGPLLLSLGASAGLVGIVSGLGEATSLIGRLISGPAADRTGRYWLFAILGYAATAIAVPAMGFVGSIVGVSALVIFERFGKSLRTPSRDAMLSHAASAVGKGKGFALHEMMDQIGAMAGPLIVAGILSATHNAYGPALGVLAIPGAIALIVLLVLRRRVPNPSTFEEDESSKVDTPISGKVTDDQEPTSKRPSRRQSKKLPDIFWIYTCFCGIALAGVGTFGVMSYHMVDTGLFDTPAIPVLYAIAMGVDALFALITGSLYDKIGTKALLFLPIVSALIPCFVFTQNHVVIIAGVMLWGASLGIQESTMRAAVADIVLGNRRAGSYGMFSVAVGVGALIGGIVVGLLYDVSPSAIMAYSIVTESIALIILAITLNKQKRR